MHVLTVQWHRPSLFEVPGDLVVSGSESKEKEVQAEREGKVLAQLFLSKARYVCVVTRWSMSGCSIPWCCTYLPSFLLPPYLSFP